MEDSNFQETIKNRTVFCGDNLDVLRGFNSNSVDLIYLDPPFNKKKQFSAPIGSNAEGASFKDWWGMEDVKNAWILMLKENYFNLYNFIELSQYIGDKSNKYYLCYMAMRLLEMKRILKDTGSIYVHCDSTMAHYLKLLMDVIFGENNFRNEIVWSYKRWTNSQKQFQSMHDNIFFYSKTDNFIFNQLLQPHAESTLKAHGKIKRINNVVDGKLITTYTDEEADGVAMNDVWDIKALIGPSKERVGYPTQKPLALIERIVKASCPVGGLVLDPFCGCATTCVASEKLGRKWVGIDVSKKAFELVQDRLHREIANPEDLFASKNALIFREDIADRTDIDSKKLVGVYKKDIKERLYGKQHGNCKGCDQHFHIVSFDIDHIVPKAKGGSDEETNLQLLCTYCNRVKGDRPMEWLKAKLDEIRKNK